MPYRESQLDIDLRNWFCNDYSRALLRGIKVSRGNLRGIANLDVDLQFPISAFCGANGAGKSTILALACCAYHNRDDAFKLPKRKTAYYTFSDFFIQHVREKQPQHVQIRYKIAHDKWKKSEDHPNGKGLGWQIRQKKQGGKWTDYESRVKKPAIFLGIQRIVPHVERSQARSYSRAFSDVPLKGWEPNVRDAVGSVLGRNYQDFRYLEHSTYSLPLVQASGNVYSGFNMGAGENALFEIFSVIYASGGNAVIVIDEIELGLHVGAQRRFVEQLKKICFETKTQVICTTHSKEILDCLPNEGRFFIEHGSRGSIVTCGISPEFAFSKLGAQGVKELDVFVEDDVAKNLLQAVLPSQIRTRISIKVIGSASAISRQLAALYMREPDEPAIAVFDGDQKSKEAQNVGVFLSNVETDRATAKAWCSKRVCYLPGDSWPERWMLERSKACQEAVAQSFSVEASLIENMLDTAIQAGKHNEFHEMGEQVSLDKSQCCQKLAGVLASAFPNEFLNLRTTIGSWLESSQTA
jgi:ABC-type multidrug transport system ATPase subunit